MISDSKEEEARGKEEKKEDNFIQPFLVAYKHWSLISFFLIYLLVIIFGLSSCYFVTKSRVVYF